MAGKEGHQGSTANFKLQNKKNNNLKKISQLRLSKNCKKIF